MHFRPVAILCVIKKDEHAQGVYAVSMEQESKDPMSKDVIPDDFAKPIPVARQVTIPTTSETGVLVTCDGAAIMCVDTHLNLNRRRSALIGTEIPKVMAHEPFHVRV